MRVSHVEGHAAPSTVTCSKRGLAVWTHAEANRAGFYATVTFKKMPQYPVCHDKIVAAARLNEALCARRLIGTQRLRALMQTCGRGVEKECPDMDAPRRNMQSLLCRTEQRRIRGQ